MSTRRTAEPYGPAYAGRALLVVRSLEAKDSSAGWQPLEDDAGRYAYHCRAYDEALGTLVVSAELDTSLDADGVRWINDLVPLGADETSVLRWDLLAEDTSTADTDGLNAHATIVLEQWYQAIKAKPPA